MLRFINPDKCKVQLNNAEEESKGAAMDSLDEETLRKLDPSKSFGRDADDEEIKQIRDNEKTVNIRFGNYSMIMRAS
jgi:hypothetical protein